MQLLCKIAASYCSFFELCNLSLVFINVNIFNSTHVIVFITHVIVTSLLLEISFFSCFQIQMHSYDSVLEHILMIIYYITFHVTV